MKIPGVRLLVPVLIGTLFAACSPTRTVTHGVTASDFAGAKNVLVNDVLYSSKGVHRDTLVCVMRTQASPSGDGTRIPLTLWTARAAGLNDGDVLALSFRPDAVMLSIGDTLLIPFRSIGDVTRSETNPLFVIGMAVVVGAVVYVGVVIHEMASEPFDPFNRSLRSLGGR
jgi:hypothetical protein